MRHAYITTGVDEQAVVNHAKRRLPEPTKVHRHGQTLTAYVGDRPYQRDYSELACSNLGCYIVVEGVQRD